MERRCIIGIGNLLASVFGMYWVFHYCKYWWSDLAMLFGFIWFCLVVFNLICFAWGIGILDLDEV